MSPSLKSMADIERHLQSKGWHLARAKSHRIWRCECGVHTITLPFSPKRNGNAFKNYVKMVEHNSCQG